MEYWTNNQIKIPKLGFGTYMLKGEQAVSSVKQALNLGLRHIDTAQIYFNSAEVGTAIKESVVPREEVFLTTKIWKDFLTPKEVKKTFQESLDKLKTDYVDLLLIHWNNPKVPLEETLGAFKDLKEQKKILHIGVSNFTCDLLKSAKTICPDIITNQVEYHPFLSQKKLLKLMDHQGIFLTAYSPLMRAKVFKIQQIIQLAKKYKKTPAQIALKWLIQQKNVVVIYKASTKKHIEENLNIFDFNLEERDNAQLFRLNNNRQRVIDPPFAPQWDV